MPIAEWRFVVSLQCREAGRWGTRIHIKKESFQATLSRPEMTARNIIPLPRSRHRRKKEAMDLLQSVSVHPGASLGQFAGNPRPAAAQPLHIGG